VDYIETRLIFLDKLVRLEECDSLRGDVAVEWARKLIKWWDWAEIMGLLRFSPYFS
jgi:hypothetical protein